MEELLIKQNLKMTQKIINNFISGDNVIMINGVRNANISSITGNGDIVTEESGVRFRNEQFKEITCCCCADICYHKSEEHKVTITADSNLMEYVQIFVSCGTLCVELKKGFYSFTKFNVDVYCPALNSVSISGSGTFNTIDNIISSDFEANVSGSGNITGHFECNNFTAEVTGSGGIKIEGESDNADIIVTGSGDFKGKEFLVKNASVKVTGSGGVKIHVLETFKGRVSGSGDIVYYGDPSNVDTNVRGSGNIKKKQF